MPQLYFCSGSEECDINCKILNSHQCGTVQKDGEAFKWQITLHQLQSYLQFCIYNSDDKTFPALPIAKLQPSEEQKKAIIKRTQKFFKREEAIAEMNNFSDHLMKLIALNGTISDIELHMRAVREVLSGGNNLARHDGVKELIKFLQGRLDEWKIWLRINSDNNLANMLENILKLKGNDVEINENMENITRILSGHDSPAHQLALNDIIRTLRSHVGYSSLPYVDTSIKNETSTDPSSVIEPERAFHLGSTLSNISHIVDYSERVLKESYEDPLQVSSIKTPSISGRKH